MNLMLQSDCAYWHSQLLN